ncbi:MAG: hypothetical protein M3Y87_26375 [Myxococcota bacterium]|nr:hypothetical protein [Myxococcota bacterium]
MPPPAPKLFVALTCALAACGVEAPCPVAELGVLQRSPAYAVALSDYGSTAIALLDAEGEVITEAWIDSGTRASAISAGLGADVVLPAPLLPGHLVLLERWNTDLLTIAAFDTGAVRQIDVRGDPERQLGASPNAQDVLRIDDHQVLVSRANPSLVPRTPELALGNDVVVVDLTLERVVRRIDLAADVVLPAPTPDDPEATIHVYARPSTLVMLARGTTRRALVGLQRLDLGFTRTGPAAIAVIDPDTQERTQLLELPELSLCDALATIPGAPDRALALCTGDSFAGEAQRRTRAGILRLALDDAGRVRVELEWRADDHPGVPSPTSSPLALDAARALFVADPRGEDDGTDQLTLVDLERGEGHVVFEAGDAFVLGESTWDPERALLLVPDADAGAVHRWWAPGGSLTRGESVPLPTCRTLPPRAITRL